MHLLYSYCTILCLFVDVLVLSMSIGTYPYFGGDWLHFDNSTTIFLRLIVLFSSIPVDGSHRANFYCSHILHVRPSSFWKWQLERHLIAPITLFNYLLCFAAFNKKCFRYYWLWPQCEQLSAVQCYNEILMRLIVYYWLAFLLLWWCLISADKQNIIDTKRTHLVIMCWVKLSISLCITLDNCLTC